MFFFRLSPDWVLRAVEAGGFRTSGHIMALNSLENRVYDVRLEDGSHVVAKFYRPERWSRDAIGEEHRFLIDLREAEIPAPVPLEFADGATLHEVEGILYAIWPRVGGRAPDELDDEQLEILGRLLGRIHNVGAAQRAVHRRTLGPASYVHEPLEYLEAHHILPPQWEKRYRTAAAEVASIYEKESRRIPAHRIHGDCHLGNLIHGRAQPATAAPASSALQYFFIDFDDSCVGPAVQDVWMLTPGRDEEALRQREILLGGYRQFRHFEDRWLRLVEILRAMRFIHYAAWIARRWKDPSFPSAFPHFGTEQYWERETCDLENQLGTIREVLSR